MKQIYHDIFNTLLTLRIRTENGKKGVFFKPVDFYGKEQRTSMLNSLYPKLKNKCTERNKQEEGNGFLTSSSFSAPFICIHF